MTTNEPPAPLSTARAITKLPAADLERARRFYRDKLGLEAVEEREGGLRYLCGQTEFHLFASTGAPSGTASQMGFEVEDIERAVAALTERGVAFDRVEHPILTTRDDGVIVAPDNYPSKGTGELGAFFRDSEGNVLAVGQATGPTGDA